MRWRSPSKPRCSGLIGSVGWRHIWVANRPIAVFRWLRLGRREADGGCNLCPPRNSAGLTEV
jgi:hypothetical protein